MNKRKRHVPEYFLGGSLKKILPAAAGAATSFIPGVGPALAPVASAAVGAAVNSGGKKKKSRDMNIDRTSSVSQGYAQGGAIDWMGQNAMSFTGPSHEGGGIQLPNAEVEGGETMDFIEFKSGGKITDTRDGSAYVFSKRLKVPGTNTSFADYHKKLVKGNANEQKVRELAQLQESVSGRDRGAGGNKPEITNSQNDNNMAQGGKMKYQNGGPPQPFPQDTTWYGNQAPAMPLANPALNNASGNQQPYQPMVENSPLDPTQNQFMGMNFLDGMNGQNQFGPQDLIVGEQEASPNSGTTKTNNQSAQNNQGNQFNTNIPQAEAPNTGLLNNSIAQPQPAGTPAAQGVQTAMDMQGELASSSDGNINEADFDPSADQTTVSDTPLSEAGQGELTPTSTSMTGAEAGSGATGAGQGQGMGQGMQSALQFVPEIMNFATGALSEPDVPEATQVSDQAVQDMPENVNVNPQLLRNAQNYRAILADPNATTTQKLAAQAQKQQADAQVFADKVNREAQMQSNRARLQSNIDRQNAQFSNQRRTEQMKADAMFGPTGNMARQAIGSASQKLLMQQAQDAKKRRDQQSTAAIISQLDPALQEKFAQQLGLLQ